MFSAIANLKLSIFLSLLFILFCNVSETSSEVNTKPKCKKPFIDILISPVFANNETNILELIWSLEDFVPGTMLILMNSKTKKAEYEYKLTNPTGFVSTNISYKITNTTYGFKKQALDYYVELKASASGPVICSSNMETNPTWMQDNAAVLSKLSIREMFIPGTHDSGASTEEDDNGEQRVQKYVMTQDETILNQFIFGIRSVDLRIAYYSVKSNDSSKLWLNHGVQRICPFSTIVNQIKKFMENTKEIVTLDLHQFPVGFSLHSPGVHPHDILVEYLKAELGQFIAPASLTWNAKLEEFWKLNKTLIIAYNDEKTQQKYSDILWLPITQKWANAQDIQTMKKYMDHEFNQPPAGPWSTDVSV
uniref:PI-PLC X domain-containing protein 1 n=1 Tax=Cacopsylla melanoneura TaxID=428564 RepID=A0A8D8WPK1_9HEMI